MTIPKTPELTPTAFNFFISSLAGHRKNYVYDAAGESVQSSALLVRHRFYDHFHCLIFIIDSFSIPEMLADYDESLKRHNTAIKLSGFLFWGKPILGKAEMQHYRDSLAEIKTFLESLQAYSTPLKFKNFCYTAGFVTAQWSGLKIKSCKTLLA